MKIEQNAQKFQPVVITLETPKEVALFTKLYGSITYDIRESFGLDHYITCELYKNIRDFNTLNLDELPTISSRIEIKSKGK